MKPQLSEISDGRYIGANGRYWLVLRVDVDQTTEDDKVATVSGDIQSTGPEAGAGYASFRSVDLSGSSLTEAIAITWTDAAGNTTAGRLCLTSTGTDDEVGVRLEADAEIGGLPEKADVAIRAHRAGDRLRDLTVEIVVEEHVDLDLATSPLAPFADRLADCWKMAGFSVETADRIPAQRPSSGEWAESDIFATLQQAMTNSVRDGGLDRADWAVRLLALSRTDRTGLDGVMFDLDGSLPRQGAAIFVDAIRDRTGAIPDRETDEPLTEQVIEPLTERMILKAAVHELGHALNLRHPFDPELRRSGSWSPMNYDWRYPGGPNAYWLKYRNGCFEPEERAFLRHGPHSQVIPGGAPFGSAVYWKAGSGIATDPGEPWHSLKLWLTPPSAGTSFRYGQPILLEVSLLNTGAQPVWVPRHILDLKAGCLDILISKIGNGAGSGAAAAKPFMPMMQRCFSVAAAQGFELGHGESVHANANLTYGSGGSDFPDPGLYELTPVLTFAADSPDALDRLVVGPSLQIRVEAPRSRADERDGETLMGRSDIGISLALAGATCFQAAAGEMAEMRERRLRNTAGGPPDPVAICLTRVAGIFAGRTGNLAEAVALLSSATTPEARRHFDPHTAEHTTRLAASYAAKLSGDRSNPADPAVVVVDFWTAPKAGPISGGRGSGFLTSGGAPSGPARRSDPETAWGVLAPAGQLTAEAMNDDRAIAAVVTVSSGDGVTQRVAARRIDLVSESDGGDPVLALVELTHPVPGRFESPAVAADAAPLLGRDVASFFGGAGGARLARRTDQELDAWSEAADEGLADAPRPRMPLAPPAIVHRYRGTQLDDVAGWACNLLGWGCQTPGPPPNEDTRYRLPYRREPGYSEPSKYGTSPEPQDPSQTAV